MIVLNGDGSRSDFKVTPKHLVGQTLLSEL